MSTILVPSPAKKCQPLLLLPCFNPACVCVTEEEPRAAAAGGAESSAGAEVDVDAGVVIGGGIGVGVDVAVRSPQSEKTPISAPSSATSEEPPECGCPHSA